MPGLTLKLRRGDSISIGPHVVISCVKDEEGALVLAIMAPGLWEITRYHAARVSDTAINIVDKNHADLEAPT